MRVENIGTPRNIPDSPQRPGLAEGDILVAEVTDIKGDKVFLKNQDGGAVLTAKLLSDIGVSVGDYVETVVDEASGGRYVLRVVDISRQAPFATGTEIAADSQALSQAAKTQALLSTLAMLKNIPGADPKAAAFLSKHGLTGTTENIVAMSQMAKSPSPVTALLSQIIKSFGAGAKTASLNEQAAAAPSIALQNFESQQVPSLNSNIVIPKPDANAALQEGGAKGQATAQIQPQINTTQGQTAQTQARPLIEGPVNLGSGNTPATAAQQVSPTQTNTQNADVQKSAAPATGRNMPSGPVVQSPDTAQPQTQHAMPTAANEPVTPGEMSQTPQPSQMAPVSPGGQAQAGPQTAIPVLLAEDIIAAPQLTANDITATSQSGQTAVLSALTEEAVPAQAKETANIAARTTQADVEMLQMALEMFVPLDDAEKLAVHIKKAVREMPDQLKTLKLLADSADNHIRETVSSKLDQIEKQMTLMSEVKRFDCYQIPIQTAAQQPTTAELFVYKYRGSKKTVDPDNILILLGLDTQHMGRVETLVKTSGKNLNIEFNLEDMRLEDEMRGDAAELKDVVQQAGYTLLGVSVKQLGVRTTVLNAEERFEKEADDSTGNLDIRV